MRWVLRLHPVLGRDPLVPTRKLLGFELACRTAARKVIYAYEFNYAPLVGGRILTAADYATGCIFLGNSALAKRMRVTHRAPGL